MKGVGLVIECYGDFCFELFLWIFSLSFEYFYQGSSWHRHCNLTYINVVALDIEKLLNGLY